MRTTKKSIKTQGETEAISFRLENFRPFRDSGEFQLAPLTCLVGANSSGKSSIITGLLLLKQSLEQERMSSRVMPLMLSGPYCDLGNFRDVVHAHRVRSHIKFSFRVPISRLRQPPERRTSLVRLEIPRSALQDFRTYGYYFYFRRYIGIPRRGAVTLSLSFASDAPFGPSLSRIEFAVDGVGSAYFLRTTGGERRQHWRAYTTDLPSQSVRMSFSEHRFFPTIRFQHQIYDRSPRKTKRRLRTFLEASDRAVEYVVRLLYSSDVIGPFRTPPERRYAFGGFSSNRSGPRGDQAIDLLITEELLKTSKHPLRSAVSFWLQHLCLGRKLSFETLAKNIKLFQLNLEGAGGTALANFADVGYGVSQVLPVIVQGLLMRPGSVYMVQEPELHLHPDAQAGLADFFLYLASYGISVVVETHSENLLIRLRRRLAEGKLDIGRRLPGLNTASVPLKKENVAILRTEITARCARLTELTLGESFQFENLPRDFMGQAIADRIALLKAAGTKQ